MTFEVQSPPKQTKDGARWFCNACPYDTLYVDQALSHVRDVESPFPHMMFEKPAGDRERKSLRRIVWDGDRVVVQTKKRGSDGEQSQGR